MPWHDIGKCSAKAQSTQEKDLLKIPPPGTRGLSWKNVAVLTPSGGRGSVQHTLAADHLPNGTPCRIEIIYTLIQK